jgi:hypothetical protein
MTCRCEIVCNTLAKTALKFVLILFSGTWNPKGNSNIPLICRGARRGHDRMVVGFTTTCAISAYHH